MPSLEFDRFFDFSTLLQKDRFVLSYSGYVSEDILQAVGDTLRQRLADHVDNPIKIRNVFSIFVELMQNLIRYADDGPQPEMGDGNKASFGVVMIADTGKGMEVMAGNFVTADEATLLRDRVEHLSELSNEDLRSLYREKLRQPSETQSKGASVGLIEIARRSSLPVVCDYRDADDGLKFFMIKATV